MTRTCIEKYRCRICGITKKPLLIEKDTIHKEKNFSKVPKPICKRCFKFFEYTGQLRNANDKEIGAIKKTRKIMMITHDYFLLNKIEINLKDFEKWIYNKLS